MKQDGNNNTVKNLTSLSREELLLEVEKLHGRIRELEYTDTSYRPSMKVDLDDNLLVADRGLFAEILEKIDEVVYYVRLNEDGSRVLRYLSQKTEIILGVNYNEYINKPTGLVEKIHPDDLPGIFSLAKLLRQLKTPQTFRYRYKHPVKNKYIWLEERIYPQFDSSGRYSANLGIYRDVTDREEGEIGYRESKQSLERVLNTIEEVVYHIDLTKDQENRIRFLGSNIEKVFGISREEFIGVQGSFMDNCHPADILEIREKANKIKEDKQSATFLYRYYKKAIEDFIWIEERVIPEFDKDGNQTAVFGVARDVTEQIVNRERLRESEERFRVLAQNANDIIYKLTFYPEPKYEFISQSVEKIMGYSAAEYYRDSMLGFTTVHKDDREKRVAAFELMKANSSKIFAPDAEPLTFRYITKGGTEIWTETNNRPVFDKHGKVIGIEGISRDITLRKNAERALHDSRESYKSLVEQHPEGIVIANSDGIIVFINPAVLRIARIETEKEIIGKSVMRFLSPEQKLKSADKLRKVMDGVSAPFETIQLVNARGEIVEMESRPTKYKYQGEPSVLIFLRDISAEKPLETEQLRLQIVEEANRSLEREIRDRITIERELTATQNNLRMLIDSSLDMICASDTAGNVTEFNAAAQAAFGYTYEEVIGKSVTMLYVNQEERREVMKTLDVECGSFSGEVLNRRKDGTQFTAFLSASVLKDQNGKAIGSMGVSRDISSIKTAELELRLSEEKYRAIYSQAYIGIAIVDKEDGKFTEVNRRLCDILGYEIQEMQKLSVADLRLAGDLSRLPSGQDFIKRGFERIFDEQRYKNKAGVEVILNVTISLVKDENGMPLHFVYVYEDITPKRRAEEQIRLQSAKMTAIFESSSHMIWTVDRDYKLVSFNSNQVKWLRDSYEIKPHVGMPMLGGAMLSTSEYNAFWKQKIDRAFAGEALKFETYFINKRGVKHWREVFLSPIHGGDDAVIEASCIAHDITDQKEAEASIRQSLKEKEVLLKEVHHRVKNNLQVISSILNLQSSYVKDKKSLDLLLESQNRIKSMAFVHESLYQTRDFSNINFSTYVENICSNLVHSYSNPDNPPELEMDLDSILLNLDTAIPCGLIINELVSNALKYAFKGKRKGKLSVIVKLIGETIRVVIADNGKGLSPDIDFRNTESLGLQLVVTLVEQINGNIQLESQKGAKFTFEFKPVKINH